MSTSIGEIFKETSVGQEFYFTSAPDSLFFIKDILERDGEIIGYHIGRYEQSGMPIYFLGRSVEFKCGQIDLMEEII